MLRASVVCAALVFAFPASAQTLRIGLQADPATLDPAQSVSFVDRVVMAAVCDKLVELDAKLAYVPQLATEWAWAADGLALTLKLRAGVLFHDGEPLDAEAVKFNIERYKTAPWSRRVTELKPVKAAVVVDPMTVRLELSEPNAPLMAQLADRAGMMVSPKAARELGDRMAKRPVCAGPYRFVEWVPQDRIVFEKFDRYWNAAAVTIDRVSLSADPGRHRAAHEFARGKLPADRARRAERSRHRARRRTAEALREPVARLPRAFDQRHARRGREVAARQQRQAARGVRTCRSIERSSTRSPSMARSSRPASRRRPARRTTPRAFPVPARDLARAKALVAENGGRPAVNLLIGSDPLDSRVAQVIQAMAGEAGFEVKITVMEAATLLNRITNGNYEVSLLIWSGRADPDANMSIWVACDGFVNYGKYCEPKLDDILRRARQTTEVAERKRLYAEAAAIYLPARPYLFLYHLKWFWGASAKLTGIVPHPDGIIRLQGLRL